VFERRSAMDETRRRLKIPVQYEGIEVGSVGPNNGAQLVIHSHLREVAGIGQRLEHGAMQLSREIDIARTAVAEAKPELVVTKHVYRGDAYELHGTILRQRVDGLGRAPSFARCQSASSFSRRGPATAGSGCGLVDLDGRVALATARLRLDAHVDVDVQGIGNVRDGAEVGNALTCKEAEDDRPLDAQPPGDLGLRELLGLADVL
jgi:hypothetical protein